MRWYGHQLRLSAYLSVPLLLLLLWVCQPGSAVVLPSSVAMEQVETSIIVPAYKEAPNLRPLVERVFSAVEDPRKVEVVVVDDNSQDGTVQACELLRNEGYNVHLVVRTDASGLSSAVLRGFTEAQGSKFIVMDADLQHPPEALPLFITALTPETPFVLGTRYGKGVQVDKDWPMYRRLISWGARSLARPLTSASDPMTGFFGLTKALYLSSAPVNPTGFKIALELLLKTGVQSHQLAEVPFSFSKRVVGESKLSSKVIIRYVGQLGSLYRWRYPVQLPIVFEFGLVGVLWLAMVVVTELWNERIRRQAVTMQRKRKRKDDV